MEERDITAGPVRFRCVVAGSGSPVVLLAGGGGWRLTFESLLGHLARQHTVYAVDPPGQGGTRVVDASFGYGVDAIADALAGFLDALGLTETAIVGHSWGGGFALRLAQRHPGHVERLALLAPGGLDVPDIWEFRLLRLPVIGELASRFTTAASVRHMMHKSFANPDRMPSEPALRAAAATLRTEPALRHDMLKVERSVDWSNTEKDLSNVHCPVMIVWGARDRYFPVGLLSRFSTRLPDAETHVVRNAGHSVHDDAPAEVLPLLDRFLALN